MMRGRPKPVSDASAPCSAKASSLFSSTANSLNPWDLRHGRATGYPNSRVISRDPPCYRVIVGADSRGGTGRMARREDGQTFQRNLWRRALSGTATAPEGRGSAPLSCALIAMSGLRGTKWRRGRDSNPRNACALNGFRDRPDRPLRHLSGLGARDHTDAHERSQA